MKSIEMHGSKWNPAVVARRSKEEFVKANSESHFEGLNDEATAQRLGEIHEACVKAVEKSKEQPEAPAKATPPAKATQPSKAPKKATEPGL